MKVLSLTQPWASLVAIGEKCVETRSWGTRHRGPLAIAAAKGMPRACKDLILDRVFSDALVRGGYKTPRPILELCGHIVAIVDVVDCLPTDGYFVQRRLGQLVESGRSECVFGDYSVGRFGWLTTNLRRLARPIPAKGTLGLWEYPDAEILAAID